MAKIPCAVCGKELSWFSGRIKISDGAVCVKCLNSAGISILNNVDTYTQQSIKELVTTRQTMVNNFHCTKDVDSYIQIDENNKYFKIDKDIFSYENLLSFELLENGQSITKGGLGSAVAGGLLFGGVGAIVGSVTGGKKSSAICNSMKLRVSLKNAHTDIIYIVFIRSETKCNGFVYNVACNSAQKCIAALEVINDINQSNYIKDINASKSISQADEIVKFKALLDQGIITQEEFDIKKKELLGL